MKLSIDTIRSDFDGFSRIARIASDTQALTEDVLELDFSDCTFFEANMVAPLYTVIARLFENLNEVTLLTIPVSVEKILRKNHFLSLFGAQILPDSKQTTLPFKIFKLHAGEQFSDYLDIHMEGKGIPEMSAVTSRRFRQSLFEIFQNAALHSESKSGIFICGQFFPQLHRLDFSIADAGIGIRESVRRYLRSKINSCDAIRWALVEGNTTKTNQPGGLGLKLLKEFIRMNAGKLQIVSRLGYYEFSAEGESIRKMGNDFPGTCVNIEINTQDTKTYHLASELQEDDIL